MFPIGGQVMNKNDEILTDYGVRLVKGEDGLPHPIKFVPTGPFKEHWNAMVDAGVKSQKTVPGAIPIGGTIAAFYANHRLSYDLDHLLMHLRGEFQNILETLEDIPDWKLAKKSMDKVILGSLGNIEVGFRQIRRKKPLKTVAVTTPYGDWVIPTFGEMMNLKAAMIAVRGAVRDFLDFLALAKTANNNEAVLTNMMLIDSDFEGLQSHSVLLTVIQNLSDSAPEDLEDVDLKKYKGLKPEFQDWEKVKIECQGYGELLANLLFNKKD